MNLPFFALCACGFAERVSINCENHKATFGVVFLRLRLFALCAWYSYVSYVFDYACLSRIPLRLVGARKWTDLRAVSAMSDEWSELIDFRSSDVNFIVIARRQATATFKVVTAIR